jgi:hypothetical protein
MQHNPILFLRTLYFRNTPSWVQFCKYNKNDDVNEDKMDRTCSSHGEEEEFIEHFGEKSRRKEKITRKI